MPRHLHDSGTRRGFQTGAVRDAQADKGRFDLLQPVAIFLVSLILQWGGKKYADRNWEKGIPISVYLDSGLRHVFKYLAGLREEPHLSQACWNFLCALWTAVQVDKGRLPAALNDLPNHVGKGRPAPLSEVESKLAW